jgi:hypothetical protein
VCPLVFLAGFVDAIGGGGGLISLPAYYLAGVPMHSALATNKMSSSVGTLISTIRICKNAPVRWSLGIPAAVLALIGSHLGARLSLVTEERVLQHILLVALPVVAFFVLRKDAFAAEQQQRLSPGKEALITWVSAFGLGAYDGFYGPGTGTFLIIVLLSFAHMTAPEAAAYTKIVNLSSNLASFVTFLLAGQVIPLLGLVAGVFSIAGHYVGAGLVLKNGTKIIRPIILLVLVLLFLKIFLGF